MITIKIANIELIFVMINCLMTCGPSGRLLDILVIMGLHTNTLFLKLSYFLKLPKHFGMLPERLLFARSKT